MRLCVLCKPLPAVLPSEPVGFTLLRKQCVLQSCLHSAKLPARSPEAAQHYMSAAKSHQYH